jgi:trigger factor
MRSVQKVEFPEINEQFAKAFGQFENLDSLKEGLKKGLEKEKEIAESQRLRQEILEEIVKQTNFETPDIVVERQKERMFQGFREEIEIKLNLSFADYLSRIKKSEKDLRESFTEPAQKRVKNFLILREIAKAERIKTTDEEVEKRAQEFLKHYSVPEKEEKEINLSKDPGVQKKDQKEQISSSGLDSEEIKEYAKEVIINEKTLAKLEGFAQNAE